jgi:hypothetical protein
MTLMASVAMASIQNNYEGVLSLTGYLRRYQVAG